MLLKNKTFVKIVITVFAVAALTGCATQAPYFRLDPSLQRDVTTFNGYQYIPLGKLCDKYGVDCKWDTFVRTASLRKNSNIIIMRAGSERILVNGMERKLDHQVLVSGAVVYVPLSFARNNLGPMLGVRPAVVPVERVPAAPAPKRFTIKTIVLDTGHGGKDVGAMGKSRGTREKDTALTLSKKIKAILENAGIKVILTRSDDTFISLPKEWISPIVVAPIFS